MSKNQEGSESTFLASLIRPRLSALSAAALDQPLECPGVLQPGQPKEDEPDNLSPRILAQSHNNDFPQS